MVVGVYSHVDSLAHEPFDCCLLLLAFCLLRSLHPQLTWIYTSPLSDNASDEYVPPKGEAAVTFVRDSQTDLSTMVTDNCAFTDNVAYNGDNSGVPTLSIRTTGAVYGVGGGVGEPEASIRTTGGVYGGGSGAGVPELSSRSTAGVYGGAAGGGASQPEASVRTTGGVYGGGASEPQVSIRA